MKQLKQTKYKGKGFPSNVAVVNGDDGDLYIGYEGGKPLRLRDLLDLWYEYHNKLGMISWIDKEIAKEVIRIRRIFENMELNK